MNKEAILAVGSATSISIVAMLAACATDGETLSPGEEEPTVIAPTEDGGVDASEDADGAPCVDDCEYYPDDCTEDALCSSGLFNPLAASSGLDQRIQVNALTGRSPDDIWLAATAGSLAHFDGTSWKASRLGTQQSLNAIWLLENVEVAFGDPSRLYARGLDAGADAATTADGWSYLGAATLPSTWSGSTGGDIRIMATWAQPGARSLWLGVSTTGTVGGLWRMRYSDADGAFAVTAMSPPEMFAPIPCNQVYALDGLSADEIWATGPQGAAFRVKDAESDHPTLTAFNTLTLNTLFGVWAASSDDIWAVGASGTVRRYRGDERFWEVYEDVRTTRHLRAIAGSSPSDIWIAGDEATVFHYDGTAWRRVKVAGLGTRRPRLEHIWIDSAKKVWIAGQGILLSLGGE